MLTLSVSNPSTYMVMLITQNTGPLQPFSERCTFCQCRAYWLCKPSPYMHGMKRYYTLQMHLQRKINVAPETKFNYRYTEYNWKLLLKCPAPILHTDKNLYFCGLTLSTMLNKVKKISMQLRLFSIKSFLSRCSAKLFWTNSSSLS